MTDTHDRLRRLAGHLDDLAPPVSEEEVRSGSRTHSVRQRRSVRVWAVAAVAVAATAAALLAVMTSDDGTSSVRTMPADESAPTTDPATTTGVQETTSTTAGSPAPTTTVGGALPGERLDIYPYKDARLAVVGVATGDVLNVRSGPGTQFGVVFTLEPLADEITATGHNRATSGREVWVELRAGDRSGWARSTFLLQPGQVTDVTSQLYPDTAARPSATSLSDLAAEVARRVASGADPAPRLTTVDGPTSGDLGEITVDVIGLQDDSVGGVRLRIFAEPAGSGRFTLRTVEQTDLCSRGVDDRGVCL